VEIWRKDRAELNKIINNSLKNYMMKMKSSMVAQHS
jgi:hypothetical protein